MTIWLKMSTLAFQRARKVDLKNRHACGQG
jgi:hypothetical protein